MKILDVVLTKVCPNCHWKDVIVRDPPPPGFKRPETEGVLMRARSHMELRTDLRFICCEHCGNPVMYLHIDAVEKDQEGLGDGEEGYR